jgi:hypothetical protein
MHGSGRRFTIENPGTLEHPCAMVPNNDESFLNWKSQEISLVRVCVCTILMVHDYDLFKIYQVFHLILLCMVHGMVQ